MTPFPCSAKLQAAVVLNPGYSTLPPVFSLCLNWKGERNSSNDDNIRVLWAGDRGEWIFGGVPSSSVSVTRECWGELVAGHSWECRAEVQACANLIAVFQAMESEVNVYYKELWGPKPGYQLLTNQLQRLCMVLDVYLETEPHDPSVEGPKEFPQEKMCLRLVRWEVAGGGQGLPWHCCSMEPAWKPVLERSAPTAGQ